LDHKGGLQTPKCEKQSIYIGTIHTGEGGKGGHHHIRENPQPEKTVKWMLPEVGTKSKGELKRLMVRDAPPLSENLGRTGEARPSGISSPSERI